MTTTNYQGVTYTLSTGGLSANLHNEGKPAPPPVALFYTRAVQTKEGWLGQLLIDGEIVYETSVGEDGEFAVVQANAFLIERIKSLFVTTE